MSPVGAPREERSDFEDDGEDQGALAGVFVDVALQVDADFLFQDAPVDFFFGVRRFERFQDDVAGADHQLAAIIAEHAAGDDLGGEIHAAGVFVDGDDGDDDAVFGEVAAIADDGFFDFFQRTGVDKSAAGGYGVAAIGALFGEFDLLAVFHEQDFARDDAELVGECGVAEEMAIFTVNRDEIFWLAELQDELLFFLAGMAGDVDGAAGIVVIDERAAAEHVVEHAEDGLVVAGDDARGEDDGVIFVDGDEAVVVDGDARHRGHRLGLAAAGEHDDTARIEAANVLRTDDHAVGNAQVAHRVRDFDVVDHAAADERDFAVNARGDVDDLLNPVDAAGEAGENDAPRSGTAEIFETRDNGAFGRREAGALDVGGVGEEREDAFVAVAREGVKIESGAVDGGLIDLEVAGVDDDAERCANGEGDAVDGAVGYGDKLDFERSDFDEAARCDFTKRGGIEQAGFFEALFDEREREAGAVDGDVDVTKDVRQRADVIFVAVRENDRFDEMAILFEIGDVWNDEVDAEEFGFGEHHSGVDDNDGVADANRHHVHAEFAETTERDYCDGLLGVTQDARMLRSND
jgi:hypothetical protein